MDVPCRDADGTVARDPRQRPNVAAGLPEARQERVAERVEHEEAHRLLVALGGFRGDGLEGFLMELAEVLRLRMPAARFGGPHPAVLRLVRNIPARFEHEADAWSHRNHAAGGFLLNVPYVPTPSAEARRL